MPALNKIRISTKSTIELTVCGPPGLIDNIAGKCECKMLKALYRYLTGSFVPDDEGEETPVAGFR